jgi:hypothetical protein
MAIYRQLARAAVCRSVRDAPRPRTTTRQSIISQRLLVATQRRHGSRLSLRRGPIDRPVNKRRPHVSGCTDTLRVVSSDSAQFPSLDPSLCDLFVRLFGRLRTYREGGEERPTAAGHPSSAAGRWGFVAGGRSLPSVRPGGARARGSNCGRRTNGALSRRIASPKVPLGHVANRRSFLWVSSCILPP